MSENAVLLQGDCLEVLKELPDNSVDSLITDPPAGISFMGKSWDEDKGGRKQWIAWMTQVMTECLRVLKPGAHGLVWAIPRTSHWTASALEDAGFEIRDVITHVFGSGFPKSMNIEKILGDKAKGIGTALKPAAERWILCRKPTQSEKLSEKMDMFNVQEWEETILNIEISWSNILDALSTNGSKSTIKTKSNMITELRTLSYSILGFIQVITTQVETLPSGLQSAAKDVKNSLKDVLGRLNDLSTISAQENVISLADIFEGLIKLHQKGEVVSLTAPLSEDYVLVRKPISEKTVAANVLQHGTGGINIDASRIGVGETVPGGGKSKRGNGYNYNEGEAPENAEPHTNGRFPANFVLSHNPYCVETCTPGCAVAELDRQASQQASRFFYVGKASKKDKGAENTHPTVKSSGLMSYLIKLITPPGGVVLDPFMGSGSTGVAATKEGFVFIGIEKEDEYFTIASKRVG